MTQQTNTDELLRQEFEAWFAKNYPTLEKIWSYVVYFRKNAEQKKLFIDYVKMMEDKYPNTNNHEHRNEIVMKFVERICCDNVSSQKYKKIFSEYENEIKDYYNKINEPEPECDDSDCEGFQNFKIC